MLMSNINNAITCATCWDFFAFSLLYRFVCYRVFFEKKIEDNKINGVF